MGDFRCPECNRYLARVRAWIWGGRDGHIDHVMGTCKRHGRVQAVGDFSFEDFYPETTG